MKKDLKFDVVVIGGGHAGCEAAAASARLGVETALFTHNKNTIGALILVNSFGNVVVNDTPHFWAAPFEYKKEFGGLGSSKKFEPFKEVERTSLILRIQVYCSESLGRLYCWWCQYEGEVTLLYD